MAAKRVGCSARRHDAPPKVMLLCHNMVPKMLVAQYITYHSIWDTFMVVKTHSEGYILVDLGHTMNGYIYG